MSRSALPASLLAETVEGLFDVNVMLPPALRALCSLVANATHVQHPVVVAHMLAVGQALSGRHFVSNRAVTAMVLCTLCTQACDGLQVLICSRMPTGAFSSLASIESAMVHTTQLCSPAAMLAELLLRTTRGFMLLGKQTFDDVGLYCCFPRISALMAL